MNISSLRDAFDPRHNSLNAIRLGLASAVIVSHSFAIGMFGPEPQAGGTTLGTWAVFGFFAISGFLITGSRLSGKPVFGYYLNRVLRIFPGFIVCLTVVAFVFAPLSLLLDDKASWSLWNSATYFLRNIALYPPVMTQPAIGQTLQHVPYQGYWNGSMWTLFWEFACYILVGLAASLSRRILQAVVAVTLLLATTFSLTAELGALHLDDLADLALPLLAAFAAGALAFLHQDRIKLNGAVVAGALVVLVALSLVELVDSLSAVPVTILMLWLGIVLPLQNVGTRVDLSYGMYIYAWPVQQFLMLFAGPSLGLWGMIVVSISLTIPFAYASFVLIEKPAQSWGKMLLANNRSLVTAA